MKQQIEQSSTQTVGQLLLYYSRMSEKKRIYIYLITRRGTFRFRRKLQ
jgi:hypothetical protein